MKIYTKGLEKENKLLVDELSNKNLPIVGEVKFIQSLNDDKPDIAILGNKDMDLFYYFLDRRIKILLLGNKCVKSYLNNSDVYVSTETNGYKINTLVHENSKFSNIKLFSEKNQIFINNNLEFERILYGDIIYHTEFKNKEIIKDYKRTFFYKNGLVYYLPCKIYNLNSLIFLLNKINKEKND